MEFKEFNPGQNNNFNETNLGDGSQNIQKVERLTIINAGKNAGRVAKNMARLRDEIGKQVSEETKEAVKYYETKLKGTKDVEQKLTDGGFKPADIADAKRLKEYWAKEAFRTSDYPVIQDDNLLLYTRIVNEFKIYVMPMIEDGKPVREVMREVHERIVSPIMVIFQENGYNDDNLRYTYDHIFGMIYYLTGNCHINWKDYNLELNP